MIADVKEESIKAAALKVEQTRKARMKLDEAYMKARKRVSETKWRP